MVQNIHYIKLNIQFIKSSTQEAKHCNKLFIKRFSKYLMVHYGASFKMKVFTFVLNALCKEACYS